MVELLVFLALVVTGVVALGMYKAPVWAWALGAVAAAIAPTSHARRASDVPRNGKT